MSFSIGNLLVLDSLEMPLTAGLMAHIQGGWVRCSREAVMKICLEVLVLPGLK